MKNRGHVYMARLLYDELINNNGWLKIRTIPDENGKYEEQSYQVPDPIYKAIKANRGCFQAGAVGPDFFPDMITGQMRVHPKNSGKWLDMMFEELQKISPYSQEFDKALAFYMGWMMHYCGDMYGHHFVNLYSYGWFPSIADMYKDLQEIMMSDKLKAILNYIKEKLTDAEMQKLVDNPSMESLTKLFQGDSDFMTDIKKYIDDFDADRNFMDEIVEILADVLHLLRLINSATNIIRHMAIESFMDQIILENLTQQSIKQDEYYDLEIPHDYIRRCFMTPAAYKRMKLLSEDDEANALDVLGRYVEYYEEEYEKMLDSMGSNRAMENLQIREVYLDKWVSFWKTLVENDLKYGKVIPEGYNWDMCEEVGELIAAYTSANENVIKKTEAMTKFIEGFMGVFKPAGKLMEAFGVTLEAFIMTMLDPLLNELKELAEPYVVPVAKKLVKAGIVTEETMNVLLTAEEKEEITTNYDMAVAIIKIAFSTPAVLLACQPLFNEEGLVEKFRKEWAHLGVAGADCFNLQCPMMENALQMGKLCLLGSVNLNDLFKAEVADVRPFCSADVCWTLSELLVELVPESHDFANESYKIYLDICNNAGTVVESRTLWKFQNGHPKRIIKQQLKLTEPLPVKDIGACILYIKTTASNFKREVIKCNLYDKTTGQCLYSTNIIPSSSSYTNAKLLPMKREDITEHLTDTMENAKRVNSLSKLHVNVITGSDGTDASVRFYVIAKDGSILRGPMSLDKSTYNDFEKNDNDTYEVSFDIISDLNNVRGFAINKTDNGGSWCVSRVMVTVADGTIGDGVTIADYYHGGKKVGSEFVHFALNREALKAQEQELKDMELTQLLVVIHTKDEQWAGTDDNVFLEIYCGGNEYVRRVELDSGRNDFERDRMDTFCVNIADENGKGVHVADIQSFRITKETPKGRMNDDWVVDNVWIRTYEGGILLAHFGGDYADHSAHKFNENDNALTISSLSIFT